MYQDLKKGFWWQRMKRDIAEYVAQCPTCQQGKAEHQRPAGPLQPLNVPEWKWDQHCIGLRRRFAKNTQWA
jgi:hypothetical protein